MANRNNDSAMWFSRVVGAWDHWNWLVGMNVYRKAVVWEPKTFDNQSQYFTISGDTGRRAAG